MDQTVISGNPQFGAAAGAQGALHPPQARKVLYARYYIAGGITTKHKDLAGHLLALFTALAWGTTFVSTKVLLNSFSPVEILFIRFVTAFFTLWIVCPHRLKILPRGREKYFVAAGLCGTTLYYLLENVALTYTTASNVGILLCVIPFFTAALSRITTGEKLRLPFFAGCLTAMAGIVLIEMNGRQLKLNPIGDLLAILAALVWAVYSILVKKISAYGYPTMQTTRRTFFYGILFMLPIVFFSGAEMDARLPARLAEPVNLANLAFLGLVASAACFVTWNLAVKLLGPVRTSVYTYLGPVITVSASALILREPVTPLIVAGTALVLTGLVISQNLLPGSRHAADVRKEEPDPEAPPAANGK